MQFFIMCFVRRFVAEQISVRPGISQPFITFKTAFPQRKGNGAVRVIRFDPADDPAENLIRIIGVFPALQNKGAKADPIPPLYCCQDIVFLQAITLDLAVCTAYAAVKAVVFAVI